MTSLFGTGLGALTPLLTKVAVDDATSRHTHGLPLVIGGLIALATVRFVSSFIRRWGGGRVSLDVQHDLRQDVFAALSRLDGAGQDSLRTGQVVSRASSDLQVVQGLLAMIPLSGGQAVLFVVSVVIMLVLSPVLTLTALLVVPGVVLLTRATRNVLFPATWAAQQAAADVADIVEEDVTGVRVVKGFGQEDRELGRLAAGAGNLYTNRLRAVRLSAKVSPGMAALTSLGQVGVLALGGYLAIHGSVTLGTFLAFSLYLGQLVAPARTLSMLLILGQQARASVERVLEIIDSGTSITDPPEPILLPHGAADVRFENVRFGYTADEPVLDGFDLTVPAGATIALVGASGSGKSTVSLLLPRFYDPQAGSVRVGGVDIRTAGLADLRGTVGVVFEEAFLFSDTIARNIGYGRPDASRAEIEAAAALAEATDFIEALPDGYDTVIGERGLTLSGGQRQRLALARAMITDPRVLVLDDATSAVDPVTEAAIHATLHRLTADRTTILIAHRRSTLALADRIAVVAEGRVIDVGEHPELLARCAIYRSLLGGAQDGIDELDPDEEPFRAGREVPAPGADGITAALWPAAEEQPGRIRQITMGGGGLGGVRGRGPGRGGGGGAGPGSGMMAALQATPELLARVDALPPGTDRPPVDSLPPAVAARLAAADPPAGPSKRRRPPTGRFSLRSSLRPFRSLFVWSLLLVALDAAAGLALPVLVKGGVDHGVAESSMSVVLGLALASLAVVLADYVVQRFQLVITGQAGEGVLYQLRIRQFAQLQRLGLDYYEREMAGRIMTRMTTDVDALSSFLQTGLITAVVSLATFGGIAVVLLVMNPGLALVAFAVLPPLLVATFFFRRYSSRAYAEAREKVGIVNADLQENVSGLRITQALRRESANAAGFAARSDDYRRSRMRAQTAISLFFPFVAFLCELSAALVLGVGAHWVVTGALSAGTLIAFELYLDSFFTPVPAALPGVRRLSAGRRRSAPDRRPVEHALVDAAGRASRAGWPAGR